MLKLIAGGRQPPPDDPDDPGPAAEEPEGKPTKDPRPVYRIHAGTAHATAMRATMALADAVDLYDRGLVLCHVVGRAGCWPSVVPTSVQSLRCILSGLVRWEHASTGPGDLAESIVRAVHGQGLWPVPALRAIQSTPPIRPDGSVAATAGYDPETGVYYHGQVLDVPCLDRRGATGARELLLDIVSDFHWGAPRDPDAWLQGLLSPLVRSAAGPCPMTMITSTTPGSGKGLLLDVASAILGGSRPGVLGWTPDDEEQEKRLMALALAAPQTILIDNVPRGTALGGPALDRALTSDRVAGRMLGQSRMLDLELRACWYATGNAITPLGDTARRTIMCRLAPRCEHPERREDFAVADLVAHTRARRDDLLRAALGIVVGYMRSGCPDEPRPPVGSFRGWSRIVRGAILWAGGCDVADCLGSAGAATDPDAEVHRLLLAAWRDALPRGATASQAIARCQDEYDDPAATTLLSEALGEVCPGRGTTPIGTSRQLGARLRELSGRIRSVDGEELRLARMAGSIASWIVERVGGREPGEEA